MWGSRKGGAPLGQMPSGHIKLLVEFSRVKSEVTLLCLLTLFNLICIITINTINHHVSLKLNFNKVLLRSPVKNFVPHQKHHLILFSLLYVVGIFYFFIKKISSMAHYFE